jgi:hypothetical protein
VPSAYLATHGGGEGKPCRVLKTVDQRTDRAVHADGPVFVVFMPFNPSEGVVRGRGDCLEGRSESVRLSTSFGVRRFIAAFRGTNEFIFPRPLNFIRSEMRRFLSPERTYRSWPCKV